MRIMNRGLIITGVAALAVVFAHAAGPFLSAGGDTDGDGVPDSVDNCTLVANADQRDTNGDGFGNICDADLNNDCLVNFGDLAHIRLWFSMTDPDADLDGNGVVNFIDLNLLNMMFYSTATPGPGPSPLGACP